MSTKMRGWMAVGMALAAAVAVLGSAQAKTLGLTKKGDFAEVARRGFFEVIDGAGFVSDPLNLASPDDPIFYQRNSYTWMSAWFNGKYIVGTVRNVDCFLINPFDPLCPASGSPGVNQRGEIWAYTPAGAGGITGTWARVLQSPDLCDTFTVPFLCGVAGVPTDLPRDVGYRGAVIGSLTLDPTLRLWIGAFGTGGRILHSTTGAAGSFLVASTNGLSTIADLADFLDPGVAAVDLGYRAILIWNGRVIAAPAGSVLDEDLPVNAVVLANNNPANTGSPWQTILNVKTDPNVGDPNNLGVFTMAVFNNALYAGITNRTTGVAIARATAAAGCPLPSTNTTPCSLTWQNVIVDGGGRQITGSNGLPDSAGVAAMKVYDPDGPGGVDPALYIGVTEAAAFDTATAELFRVKQTGPGQPVTWDLIMGRPRLKSLMDSMNADPTISADFNCSTSNVLTGANFNFNSGDDFNGDAAIGTQAACFPLSNMGAGFGGGASGASPFTGGFGTGRANYIWRLESHDDGSLNPSTSGPFLWAGNLDLGSSSSNPAGFDVLKSKDGVTWNTAANLVINDGLDNLNNYGVRTLVSVPDWPGGGPGGVGPGPALVLGTANPFTSEIGANGGTGGCEVHVGTCAPDSVLVADARVNLDSTQPNVTISPAQFDGIRYVAFDDENCPNPAVPASCVAGNKSVTVTLNGTNSTNLFCGDSPDSALSAPGAPTVALAVAVPGNVDNGTHSYKITFVTDSGETQGGTTSAVVTVTDKTLDGQVALTAIPIGSASVTSRKIYRTAFGNALTGPWLFLATIGGNITTIYTDNIADSGLGAAVPTTNGTSDYQWYIGTVANCATPLNLPVTTGTPNTGAAATITGLALCTDASCAPPALIAAPLDIGSGFADHRFFLRVTSPDPTTPNPVCDEVIVRASADLLPRATITTTPPGQILDSSIPPITLLVDSNPPDPTVTFPITGVCAPSFSSAAIASCVWSFGSAVDLANPICATPCSTTATVPVTPLDQVIGVLGSTSERISLTATDGHGYKTTATIGALAVPEIHDGAIRDISDRTASTGVVFVPHVVRVRVYNQGTVQEPFVVSLVDSTGGVVSPPSVTANPFPFATLGSPSADAFFTWTPTSAGQHTLTATIGAVAGETDLADNQLSVQIDVNAASALLAAVLPLSRFVEAGDIDSGVASAFAAIINTGGAATGCNIVPVAPPAGAGLFHYQTTTPGNVPTGTIDTPVNIAAGATQNFIFTFTPTAAVTSTEIQLTFDCTNTDPAPSISGLNRIQLGASAGVDTTDIVALSATTSGDGIVHVPGPAGSWSFGVATVNVGDATATITASADTGSVILPLTITICETTGQPGGACMVPASSSVNTDIGPGETNTFGVFVTATGVVPNLPGTNRIRVLFREGGIGGVIHGATSVAVTTQ